MRPSLVLAVALLAGCSGQAPPSSTQAVGVSGPNGTPAATTTAEPATSKPTASPRPAAPAELQGRWQTEISASDRPILTITDFTYTIQRLGTGTGGVAVHGDQIDFFGSNLCQGTGTYGWSIADGVLTLQSISQDPCANRADAIRGRPFKRIG
jgi:hypothetical protein